jgi:YVTN family beta-propeller protein
LLQGWDTSARTGAAEPDAPGFSWPNAMTKSAAAAYLIALLSAASGFAADRVGDASDYYVYVSNERSGDVSVIDGRSDLVVRTVPAGKRPRGIHCSADGTRVYVALTGSPNIGPGADRARADSPRPDKAADGVGVIDTRTFEVMAKLEAGSDPEQFAVNGEGTRLFMANEDVGTASILELPSGKKLTEVPVAEEPEGVGINPVTGRVYVTCETEGIVYSFDPSGRGAVHHFKVGGRPRSVAFLPDGSRAYVPSETDALVSVIDTAKDEVIATIPFPKSARPMGTTMSRDGKELYVSTGRGNTVTVLDTARNTIAATIPVGGRVWGVTLSPDGTKLYTANGTTNDVSVIDVQSRREIKRIQVGQGPWGVAVAAKPQQ